MRIINGVLLIVFTFFIVNVSSAQSKIGVRFFQGFQNQATESQYLVGSHSSVDYKLELGTVSNSQTVGLFTQFEFGFIYVQPEFLYTSYNMTYELEDFNSESSTSSTSTIQEQRQQFDIPINAGVKFKNFRIGGGPVFHVGQDITSDFRDYSDIVTTTSKLSAGFQGSLGYDWKIFHFDIRYQNDFNTFTDHISFGQRPVKMRSTPSSLQVGIAVALGRK